VIQTMPLAPEVPFIRRTRVVSLLVAAALALASVLQFRGGVDAVPDPIVEILRALFDYTPELCARLIASATAASSVVILFFGVGGGNRVLPVLASAIAAFIALACVSRAFTAGGLGFPLLALVVAGTLLLLAVRAKPLEPGARRGLSPAWTALGLIALATAIGGAAARATDPNSPKSVEPAAQAPKVVNIDFDMHPYVGRRVEETPIADYLPTLAERARGKTTFVVFYMPNCSACHSIFRQFFAVPRIEQVLTVEIPPADGVPVADSGEEHEPIECVGCEPLLLAPGPNYLVASPMVVKIEDGVVTCVSDRFKGECLLEQ
jgi:hypothetical protein